ncbi:putative fatty-acid-CoA ligase FadD [Acrocarpospora pleiomorpha]|uniref:Putative fatty-acid-CoA ligase FadD n=1 Tax=Acrocarpospora pleiomorpha TaxID=90975 RepID=A0A5M3XNX7_9ACTN|nr:long-chain fatty acid--CoA ligase [Acrocarpospora pleiomorpha]GES21351.1 putative fatty-acid-CoA ligase FadD [Acrocarpospora pleiomorpha]
MLTGDSLESVGTIAELFQRTVRAHRDRIALRSSDGAVELTWGQYAERVERIAAGLASLGVRRGDTVALMLTNRPEFHLVDTAVLHLGATPFSVYNTSPAAQIAHLFGNAGNRVVVTERQWVATVRAAGGAVEHVVCVDGAAEGAVRLADVEAERPDGFDFEAGWRAVAPEDLVTLIYTSGTTGPPKGVELEHRAILASLRGGLCLPFLAAGVDTGRLVSYLPDAHVANRYFSHYLAMAGGSSITTVADLKTMARVLPAVRPTVFLGVPAFWYKMQAAIGQAIAANSGVRRRLADWAVAAGREVMALRTAGRPVPAGVAARYAVADRIVLRKLRARIGLDAAGAAITGAAPIAPDVVRFFHSLGIPLSEGYAMSESAAAGAISPPEAVRPGTVGPPMRGVEVKVAEDGELLFRSATLMRGYRGDPARTAEAIDAEGWLHTGDIGVIGPDGYVTIVDRKKDLIINSSGKNMSPANIEQAVLVSCPLAGSVVAVGDRRPYVVALIALDPAATRDFAAAHGLPADEDIAALARLPEVRAAIEEGVTRANTTLSRVEQIKYFRILPVSWTPGSEELTPTNKVRRREVTVKYAEEIEALYPTG